MSTEGYKFTVDGKHYTLPTLAEDAAASIPGDVTYNAVMRPDDQMAQLRLAFASLEAAKPTEKAFAALKSLPTDQMLEHVSAWMGGSSPSSD